MENSRFFILISWRSVLCCRGHHTMWVNPHCWKEPQQHLPVFCIHLRAEWGPGLLLLLPMLVMIMSCGCLPTYQEDYGTRVPTFPNSEPCPVRLVKVRTCFPWCSGPFHLFSLKLYPLPFPAMQLLAELHCWVQWTFLDLNLKGTIFSLSVFQAASMFYSLTILLFFSLKF